MASADILSLLDKGGFLVWPIIFCSLIGMTIFFERLTLFNKVLKKRFSYNRIFDLISKGNISEAKELIAERNDDHSPSNRIIQEAISIQRPDRDTLEMILSHSVEKEVSSLAKTLPTLAVIASSAPLLGLLGTVIGMIKAFIVVEEMGGSVNAAVLAGGIWEAMLTTAFGLLTAIPLLFFHNHLEGKLTNIQADLEEIAISFMKAWSKGING